METNWVTSPEVIYSTTNTEAGHTLPLLFIWKGKKTHSSWDCFAWRPWSMVPLDINLKTTPWQWLSNLGGVTFSSVPETSLCCRGLFHSDNLPLGLSNVMWADRGALCPHCCFPQGKERLLSCLGQLPFQADSTSKLQGLQSPLSYLGASQRALALSPLAITAPNTTLLLHLQEL